MNWLILICIVAWIYILYTMKRADMGVWYYLCGSVGFFIFSMVLIEPHVVAPLQKAVSAVAGLLGDVTGVYKSYFQQGILFIASG